MPSTLALQYSEEKGTESDPSHFLSSRRCTRVARSEGSSTRSTDTSSNRWRWRESRTVSRLSRREEVEEAPPTPSPQWLEGRKRRVSCWFQAGLGPGAADVRALSD